MDKNQELYHDEIDSLRAFRSKIETHAIYKEDLDAFSDEYEELVAQAKVITRVSDRLQKKLDNANMQIREQNDEIKDKNIELGKTIEQLAVAEVGKKASAIMLVVAFGLFILEQVFVEQWISENIDIPYLGLGILGILFVIIKFFEGGLEKYFLNQEKKKILAREKEKEESGWD